MRFYRVPWADLLAKVFAIAVLASPECSGRRRIAFVPESSVSVAPHDQRGAFGGGSQTVLGARRMAPRQRDRLIHSVKHGRERSAEAGIGWTTEV